MRFSLLLIPLLACIPCSFAQNSSVAAASVSSASASSASGVLVATGEKTVLSPFTTDGCSMWIDGTLREPSLWRHCCVAHDKAYWIGGTAQERRKADQALHVCIQGIAGKMMGDYMYTFVVPGGSPYWYMPYRWGYGWSYLENGMPRGYKALSETELAQVNALLPQAEQTIADDAASHPVHFKVPERK